MTDKFDFMVPPKQITAAEAYIRSRVSSIPTTAIVLGSGLGYFAHQLKTESTFKCSQIPHFPSVSVAGHQGNIIFGRIAEADLIAIQGRVHYYEGKTLAEVTFYVQLLHRLGIKNLILTNAAGSVNPDLIAGGLIMIRNFINFAQLPIIPEELAPEQIFAPKLAEIARSVSRELGIRLFEGTYCWTTGPSYETNAEVRIIRALGGDIVGMSTLPEALVAAHLGLRVLVISLVTNMATGISTKPLSHHEVQAAAAKIKKPYSKFMSALVLNIVAPETKHLKRPFNTQTVG
jgi:purine-nucleoside phosphorylase